MAIGAAVVPSFHAAAQQRPHQTSSVSFPVGSCSEETSPAGFGTGGGGQGFTYVDASTAPAGQAGCYVGAPLSHAADTTVASTDCSALQGNFVSSAGVTACWVQPAPVSAPAGIIETNFGSACPSGSNAENFNPNPLQVEVADGASFAANDSVTL